MRLRAHKNAIPTAVYIGGILGTIIAIALIVWFLRRV